jgi:hypothetical protein
VAHAGSWLLASFEFTFDEANALDAAHEALAESQAKTRILQVAQMRPGQTPEKLEELRKLERSQRAETKLWKRVIAHLQSGGKQEP